MSEHTLVWLAKMMYPWMEGQMEEQMPEQGQLYVPPPISGQVLPLDSSVLPKHDKLGTELGWRFGLSLRGCP